MSEVQYFRNLLKAIEDVGFYAYTEDCPGLEPSECRKLSELCDKAKEGINSWLEERK